MSKILKTAFFLLTLSIHSVGYSWWDQGHMTVAQIAYERLNEDVKAQVDELIPMFGNSFPPFETFVDQITQENFYKDIQTQINELIKIPSASFPLSNSFVEAATWLDKIKAAGVPSSGAWHGSSRPYDPVKILSQKEVEKKLSQLKKNDAVKAIKNCLKILCNKNSSPWEKAFSLRVLLHVVGDVHCPVHSITLYNKDFPQGDRYGTRFPLFLPQNSSVKDLHQLWDSMLLIDSDHTQPPLTPEQLSKIEQFANEIAQKYPEENLSEKEILDPETWAKESYQAGIRAYQNIEQNGIPSDEYIASNREVAQKRIALAGYRLAKILNICFSEKQDGYQREE
ncbi:MAG: S1/P1 nuclease [Gammaproteobacteria bacterium]|nr:S1/P1 nuclease [Gammaproteobacteria bacterium]